MCLERKSTSSRRYRTEGKREDMKDLSLEAVDGAIESADRMTRIGSFPIHRNLMLNKSMVRCIDRVKPEGDYAPGWPSESDAAPVARSRTLTGWTGNAALVGGCIEFVVEFDSLAFRDSITK